MKKKRILVVDDELPVCALLTETFAAHGFDSQSRNDGKAALEALEHEEFDAVVSDLNMPGMSGMDLLAEVREKFPRVVFLMVTGVNDVRTGIEAMKRGAADYVVKPFELEAVLNSVKRALEMKAMQTELEEYRQNLEHMVDERTRQLDAARRRIELTYDETLEALGAALDLRDTETAGHSQRVTRYCLKIAQTMDCSVDQLKQIARGSYLHDIGKIGIPDSILLKEGKLNTEEIQVMRNHVRIGYELVSRIAFLAGAAEIVLTHQERFDGTGYPQGLVGSEIPLGARIFSVADTLDAMTSDRPYRRALPFVAAREEIEGESGKQFDPEVVKVFLAIPERVWDEIRHEVASSRHALRKPLSLLARPDSSMTGGVNP
jgi:response regulator RpfG family c-di-GMP phosphodiesterase